jgi:DNA-binding response OmpR family regulator
MARATVLVIDDDGRARGLVRTALERGGATVVEAGRGTDGMRALYGTRPDLVLLDLDNGGRRMLDRIREVSDVPLVAVSIRASEPDKVTALRAGADDYVTKPFGADELLARSEALLRRCHRASTDDRERYADGTVEIDYAAAEARANGQRLVLTPLEFRLLVAFTRHPDRVLSAERLLQLVWGEEGTARQRVKVYVGYLRSKFREAGVRPPIETVRGFGYRYRPAR